MNCDLAFPAQQAHMSRALHPAMADTMQRLLDNYRNECAMLDEIFGKPQYKRTPAAVTADESGLRAAERE